MAYRLILVGLLSIFLSGCVTGGLFNPRSIPPTTSTPISKEVIAACRNTACLLTLAKSQNSYTHEFENQLAKVGFAATHILQGEETEAIAIIDGMNNDSVRSIFYRNFGAIDKGKIDKFIADTQRWENVDLPLPASLLGRNEDYDTLYAFFLAIGGDFESAARLVKTLKLVTNKNKVYYLLALHALKDRDVETALRFASEIKGDIKSRNSRPRIYSLIYNSMYKTGDRQAALAAIDRLNYIHDKDGARAGIAIAMASENALDQAIDLTSSIVTQRIRLIAYSGMLRHYAGKGALDQIDRIIKNVLHTDKDDIPYPQVVSALAATNHLPEAEDFLQDIPNDVQTIYALSELGKVTGDSSYFQQSLVLAKALQDREDTKLMKGTLSLAANMAQAGYFDESVRTLHIYKQPVLRKISRELIFKSLHSSPYTPKEYETILDFAEQDLLASDPKEYDQILKNATKLMLVNRADLASLKRYLKLVDRVSNKFNRETLYGRVIPHLAYLGEMDQVNSMIAGMTHTMPRIWALLRLAEFHILKAKINTI